VAQPGCHDFHEITVAQLMPPAWVHNDLKGLPEITKTQLLPLAWVVLL